MPLNNILTYDQFSSLDLDIRHQPSIIMPCVMRLSTFKTSPKEAVQKKRKKEATFRESFAPEILFRGKEIRLSQTLQKGANIKNTIMF